MCIRDRYGSGANAAELCNLFKGHSFSSDRNADRALDKILSVTGLAKNFILQQCNGILYNRKFVLVPLCELSPTIKCPFRNETVEDILLNSDDNSEISLFKKS